jgi:hypothetical protein
LLGCRASKPCFETTIGACMHEWGAKLVQISTTEKRESQNELVQTNNHNSNQQT